MNRRKIENIPLGRMIDLLFSKYFLELGMCMQSQSKIFRIVDIDLMIEIADEMEERK
jgi:hypothetical protein